MVFRKVYEILVYGDTTPATIGSILSSFLWSACLVFPGTLIGPPGEGRPTYRHMAEVATEDTWILVLASVFVLQVWRLLIYSSMRELTLPVFLLEISIKFYAAFLWTFISIACIIAQYPPAAAMSDTLVVAVGCWWDFLRCDRRRIPCNCLEN